MLIRIFLLILFAASACLGQPDREAFLLEKIAALEARLAALEKRLEVAAVPAAAPAAVPVAEKPAAPPAQESWWKDSTANFYFDGYYSWNTNRPLGRINLLRAYDVTANNLSINQTGLVLERSPNAARPWGYRMDLMFGQATETLQGGAQNEPRPQV